MPQVGLARAAHMSIRSPKTKFIESLESRVFLSAQPVGNFTPVGANPTNFQIFGDRAVFRGHSIDYGNELWISDGTTAGTRVLEI